MKFPINYVHSWRGSFNSLKPTRRLKAHSTWWVDAADLLRSLSQNIPIINYPTTLSVELTDSEWKYYYVKFVNIKKM